MKNFFKWASLAALFMVFSCERIEQPKETIEFMEPGVYGFISPMVSVDEPETRATVDAGFHFAFEEGDRINIWSSGGTTLFYDVVSTTSTGGAIFDGGGFKLTKGDTYYSAYPVISSTSEKYTSVFTTFEGQTQTADGDASHVANYTYTLATATCDENNHTSFVYNRLNSNFRFEITLPVTTLEVKELTITADVEQENSFFALNGHYDATNNGYFTPGGKTNTMTLALDNVVVTDGVLNAFLSISPCEAANYIIRITDSQGTVYTSPKISKPAIPANMFTTFRTEVFEGDTPVGKYELVTSIDSDPAGKYILVYPNGTTYRAFSFAKTMDNAETAAASVATTAFADLYDQSSTIYNAVVGGNYVEIDGEANATTLILNPEQEEEAAITIAANAAPWTVTAPAKDLQTTLTSGSYSIGVDHLVANVASDGKADLVAAFNAPDGVAIMNSLRGHNVNVTFTDLINLAVAKTEGLTENDAALFQLAFGKLVSIVQNLVAENPRGIFPAGSTLMPITLSTNVFDVFKQYHDNAADISWKINSEKRFGLAQLGYNINAQGFTVSVNLPSYVWFNELNAAITASMGSTTTFVQYWQKFDNDSQYDVSVEGVKIENFYTKVAKRFVDSFSPREFLVISMMVGDKFTKLGQSYKALAEKLDTGIQPAYIYKKVL